MADVAFTLYKGFLIVEYSETDVKAYRSREYYAGNIPSCAAASKALLSKKIDDAENQGDITDVEYYELMRLLGRAGPAETVAQPVVPMYSTLVMDKVRQGLGLEPGDTSRDEEINRFSHEAIFRHCLQWEGIIGYEFAILDWVRDIYGVELS